MSYTATIRFKDLERVFDLTNKKDMEDLEIATGCMHEILKAEQQVELNEKMIEKILKGEEPVVTDDELEQPKITVSKVEEAIEEIEKGNTEPEAAHPTIAELFDDEPEEDPNRLRTELPKEDLFNEDGQLKEGEKLAQIKTSTKRKYQSRTPGISDKIGLWVKEQNRVVTSKEAHAAFPNVKSATVSATLNYLKSKGLLTKEGRGNWAWYMLSEERPKYNDIEEEILQFLKKNKDQLLQVDRILPVVTKAKHEAQAKNWINIVWKKTPEIKKYKGQFHQLFYAFIETKPEYIPYGVKEQHKPSWSENDESY